MKEKFYSLFIWPDRLPNYISDLSEASIVALTIICIITIMVSKDLLVSTILLSASSLLMALLYLLLDAPDVAITEASVGACVSTIILLSSLSYVKKTENNYRLFSLIPFIICVFLGGLFIYLSLQLPSYGNANSPVNTHITPYYIKNTGTEIAIPAVATAILAGYRGFDTLGETSVILTAGLAVYLLLSTTKKSKITNET